jgi:hypothetical protein
MPQPSFFFVCDRKGSEAGFIYPLSSRKYDPGFSSRIRILTFYPSRIPEKAVNPPLTPVLCRAPDDCLQYYKGFYGNLQSFNFPNGQVLSSQNYRICIRRELSKFI